MADMRRVHRVDEIRDRSARGAGQRVPGPAEPEGRARADVQAPLERVHECAPQGGPGAQGRGRARRPSRSRRQSRPRPSAGARRSPRRRATPRSVDSGPASGPGHNPGALLRSVASLATLRLTAPRGPTWAPTGERRRIADGRPGLFAKPGRANTVAGRGLRARRFPYGLPRPRSTHPSSSCTSGTAPTCSRCRAAHRPRRAARRGRRSGPTRDGRGGRTQGTGRRAHRAKPGARGR
jgi:hypothetical protein